MDIRRLKSTTRYDKHRVLRAEQNPITKCFKATIKNLETGEVETLDYYPNGNLYQDKRSDRDLMVIPFNIRQVIRYELGRSHEPEDPAYPLAVQWRKQKEYIDEL